MAVATINYSTFSEAARSRAKELNVDYEGHDRIVSAGVHAAQDAINEMIQLLNAQALADGGSIIIRSIYLPPNMEIAYKKSPYGYADTEISQTEETSEESGVVEFELSTLC